jgi:SAM-dependent methyltransferase
MGTEPEGHSHGHGHGEVALAELLDLDAEIFHSYLSEVCEWVGELAADLPCERILDLGCGTGTGTFALLARFDGAVATAVDGSAVMLERLTEKSRSHAMADRVRPVLADLDSSWPEIGAFDLVWASSSLHHMRDPDRVLTDIYGALVQLGVLVVAEIDAFPRFFPDEIGIGTPGLEARCHEAASERVHAELPYRGSDWASIVTRNGFTIQAERTFSIELTAPLATAARVYAEKSLRLLRSNLGDLLRPEDLETLDVLFDADGPEWIQRRDDLVVRTERELLVARKP